jgi:hypothetical protein
VKNGTVYGYQALVLLSGQIASKKGTSPKDFVAALQADLALVGLLVTQYKIKGKGPIGIAMEITPTKGFFSPQPIKNIVDNIIKQQTGNAPIWSKDPACCVVCTTPPCCITQQTLALVSPCGKNPQMAQNKVILCARPSILGEAYSGVTSAGTAVLSGVKSVGSALVGPLEIVLLGLLAIGALYVFVYAKGSHV